MTIVNVCSPTFDPCDSYGILATELVDGLGSLGWDVNTIGSKAPNRSIRIAPGGILLGYPTLHKTYGAMSNIGPKLALTMFESTVLPDGWVDRLNKCDAVVVPARWLVRVFRQNGVAVPIHVVPLGINDVYKGYSPRTKKTPFTFIAIGDRGLRKAWNKVIFAFNQAFGDNMDYRLIIKSRNLGMSLNNPNIEVIKEDYTDEQMAALYRRSHVMVFPSSGEGFGLPPREFAATGGISLATNWGGTADDISQWGIPLPYQIVDAWDDRSDWRGSMGHWASVDQDDIVQVMESVAANYYGSYKSIGAQSAGFVAAHYRWSVFTSKIASIWEQIAEEQYGNSHSRREVSVASASRVG
jgi:glycosyltransferase involved in cell wall biosynthesis